MTIMTKAENRPDMVKAIAEELGLEAQYQGPPSFCYKTGDLCISRDGSIDSDNAELLESIRPFLKERGWLDEEYDQFLVSLPTAELNGQNLTNIVNMVHSKQYLMNRILDGELYQINDDFIQTLKTNAPQTAEAFLELYNNLPQDHCKGLVFEENRTVFAFNLHDDPDRMKAYTQLAACIVAACKQASRVSPLETISDNEKFYVRAWLVRIGMDSSEYKQARKFLMKGLKGHSAFKTEEQKERHRIKHQAKKEFPTEELT